MHKLKTL